MWLLISCGNNLRINAAKYPFSCLFRSDYLLRGCGYEQFPLDWQFTVRPSCLQPQAVELQFRGGTPAPVNYQLINSGSFLLVLVSACKRLLVCGIGGRDCDYGIKKKKVQAYFIFLPKMYAIFLNVCHFIEIVFFIRFFFQQAIPVQYKMFPTIFKKKSFEHSGNVWSGVSRRVIFYEQALFPIKLIYYISVAKGKNAILVVVFHFNDNILGSLVNMMRRWFFFFFLESRCHKSHVC